ncbi:MAG: hypothetical protein KKA79_02950 [Nanoarchaeota archaeon]|nr:hypothetical protein [Nanoarchaeota archaeon]
MTKLFVSPENIPLLEDIIADESKKVEDLKDIYENNCMYFGPYLSHEDLNDFFKEVKKEVDIFLDVKDITYPDCDYCEDVPWKSDFDHYNRVFEEMGVVRRRGKAMVFPLSHEYTHHVQSFAGLPVLNYRILNEGHARGVDRHITNLYAEREDNKAFIYENSALVLKELKRAYNFTCDFNGIKPKSEFLKDFVDVKISEHTLGTSLFMVYEALHGKEFYKDIAVKRFPDCFV